MTLLELHLLEDAKQRTDLQRDRLAARMRGCQVAALRRLRIARSFPALHRVHAWWAALSRANHARRRLTGRHIVQEAARRLRELRP